MRINGLRFGIAMGIVLLPAASFAQRTVTLVCHVPPGNPSNAHTLSLPDAAVQAHLAHGDRFGRCESGRARSGQQANSDRPDRDRQPQIQDGQGRSNEPQIDGGRETGQRELKEQPQTSDRVSETEHSGPSGSGRNDNGGGNGRRRSLWETPAQSSGGAGQAGQESRSRNGGSQENGGRPAGKGPHLDDAGGGQAPKKKGS